MGELGVLRDLAQAGTGVPEFRERLQRGVGQLGSSFGKLVDLSSGVSPGGALGGDTLTCQTPGERSRRLPCREFERSDHGRVEDKPVVRNAKVLLERCESGRIGLTANELTWVTGSEGSNPSLSARRPGRVARTLRFDGPCRRGPAGPALATGTAWCEECVVGVGRYWLQTLGVQEPGGLRQARGSPGGARLPAGIGPRFGRPRRRQHLRLHRGRPPGVHRHRPRAGRRAAPRATAGRHGLHGRALRRRAPRGASRSGPRRRLWSGPHRRATRARRPRATQGHGPAVPRRRGFDLLELPRPAARAPWAYVKVAEGCDRICGFCAIPSFRGKQRSRPVTENPGRGRRAGRPARTPAPRPCARSSSWPRTSPPTAATAPGRTGDPHRARALAARRAHP